MSFATVPAGGTIDLEPFELSVPEQDVVDFKTLLKLSKLGPETFENLQPAGRYGISRAWLTNAKEVWENAFDWRKHEQRINSVPNFKAVVDDAESGPITIHFMALFSSRSDAIPLLCMHGWPGSFMEFLPVIELLRKKYTPDTLPYHVIVPSLPGYAMSSGPPLDRDFSLLDVARILNQLMIRLGFGAGYVAQGGDIGSMLSRILSSKYDECKAFHVNVFVLVPPEMKDPQELSAKQAKKYERAQAWRAHGFGYAIEHATRPATVGLAISSSPLALLAWIGEKYCEWVDEQLPLDTVLALVSLYWFTSSFPRCIYPYRFVLGRAGKAMPSSNEKPFGVSDFPGDLAVHPEAWIKATYPNLAHYREHDKGGHFAALEQPEILLEDVESFVAQIRDIVRK